MTQKLPKLFQEIISHDNDIAAMTKPKVIQFSHLQVIKDARETRIALSNKAASFVKAMKGP